ncbi:ABC transporter ATP-binding protein [Patulibacter sp.]|uniref:ABC transporter ATP-binding protein n=1 Tax=Patulibacter sp. TaxID=1912859 RepID=UPI0027196209|nr:ABC transporter ATP-binding protein [Patulibacter sp.]MDO9408833.1 ABC transporter ATP-binding protein [Patulibacter sp.]
MSSATASGSFGPPPPVAEDAIVVEGLRKRYGSSGDEAVKGIDFRVRQGEIFGLLGPNGAGKTTTIGVITTRVRPTGGRVLVDGLDVTTDQVAVKLRLAVVPQRPNLDRSLSAIENLTFHAAYFGFSRRARRERALELLEQVGLQGRENDRVDQYSGGMAQRLIIARALIHRPQILILDEPTTGLDPQSRLFLWDTMRELQAQGTTLILTTHDMAEADQLCERIAIVDHGEVIALDTPRGLRRLLPSERGVEVVVVAQDAVGAPDAVDADDGATPSSGAPTVPGDDPAAAIGRVPGVERADVVSSAEGRTTVRAYGAVEAGDLVAGLSDAGLRLVELRQLEGSLEDVFVHLTGRELR